METKGGVNISPNYKKKDYLNLNLNVNSNNNDWAKAVDIIKDRIKGRFFNQIDLLSNDINANGFAIMALNCLLIETLLQFKEGKKTTTNTDYKNFLKTEFPNDFDTSNKIDNFYSNIRCGILHSAQTINGSRLSDSENDVVTIKNSTLIVPVKRITEILKDYFEKYIGQLLDANETNLRSNFIEKMKFVCNQ